MDLCNYTKESIYSLQTKNWSGARAPAHCILGPPNRRWAHMKWRCWARQAASHTRLLWCVVGSWRSGGARCRSNNIVEWWHQAAWVTRSRPSRQCDTWWNLAHETNMGRRGKTKRWRGEAACFDYRSRLCNGTYDIFSSRTKTVDQDLSYVNFWGVCYYVPYPI